jgi:hypothetical protein
MSFNMCDALAAKRIPIAVAGWATEATADTARSGALILSAIDIFFPRDLAAQTATRGQQGATARP